MVKDTTALIGCGSAICPKNKVDPYRDWPYYVCSKYLSEMISRELTNSSLLFRLCHRVCRRFSSYIYPYFLNI